jgi:hypothetical protein
MPNNPNKPNSTDDIEKFSKSAEYILDSISSPASIQDVLNLATTKLGTTEGVQLRPILTEMVNNVDRPLLKNMALDVVTVMSNWFEDPQVLCCLIQGLYTIFDVSRTGKQQGDYNLANTEFGEMLDVFIAFIDVIIALLTNNVRKLAITIPDFISEIMNGVIGAVLLVLQEVLFAIRDSLIKIIIDEINYRDDQVDNWWTKCLPLAQLFEIMRKYVSDYGLFATLFEKLKGMIGQMVGLATFYKGLDFPQNIKDIEFLYWFRDLLVKLKQASISFDLCFLPPTAATATDGDQRVSGIPPDGGGGGPDPLDTGYSVVGRSNPSDIQGITVTPDGTILQDKAALRKGTTSVLTNSSVRGFLNKYYGYPLDVVDSIIVGPTSADNIQGTDTGGNLNLNADCPNSPSPAEVVAWALRVRNRNI